MRKLLTFGSVLLAVALALPAGAAQFMNIPAGPVKMDVTKNPVFFDHGIHTTMDCTACHNNVPAHFPPLAVNTETQCAVCHHKVAGTTPKFKCGTVGCHTPKDKHAPRSYFKIVHDRDIYGDKHIAASCLGCHSTVVKSRPEKKQALTGCTGSACHPKQD